MVRLTDLEQRRIEAAIPTVQRVASALGSRRLDRDERISIAYLAVCLAAPEWSRRGRFPAFAAVVARRAILRELRRLRRRPAAGPLRRAAAMTAPEPRPSPDDRDHAKTLWREAWRLQPRERQALELYGSGLRWSEVAEQMGIRPTSVERLRRQASEKLASGYP